MSRQIAILGAGNMGTALAHALAGQGSPVSIWDHFPETLGEIRSERTNRRYLPEINLHPAILPFDDAGECVRQAALVILCVPSVFIEGALLPVLPTLRRDAILLNVAKGFAPDGVTVLPEWISSIAPGHDCAHLAGPALADEFARGNPTFITIAARHLSVAEETAGHLRGTTFIPSVTTDLVGSALAGILKNPYAIFIGMLGQIFGQSHNLMASATTLCAMEMERILGAMGAEQETIRGLPGCGDLAATCTSPGSHNRRFGRFLAEGGSPTSWQANGHTLPEGARGIPFFLNATRDLRIPIPILAAVAGIIDGTGTASSDNLLDILHRCI